MEANYNSLHLAVQVTLCPLRRQVLRPNIDAYETLTSMPLHRCRFTSDSLPFAVQVTVCPLRCQVLRPNIDAYETLSSMAFTFHRHEFE